ncbi:MAG: ATP synthase F1 subunit gamma [Elusimicrobia bacterium GWA2_69_24]|nr:MAG: ATP synthase F1 subunit gamma [Elusimicrobia bacterium GWA2_69_24]HBL18067.1 ATP synthase F1 subunit gamma [Elusimicrobiota bacterium]
MASLREIRRKIQSVKSTQQITRAMKMVAAARMRKAQSGILDSRPFAVKMEGTVSELAALELEAGTLGATCVCARRFFGIPAPEGAAPEAGAAGLLLVTADKGLCGAFNANLLRAALRWIRNQQGRRIAAAAVGRKGREFLRRISDLDIEFLTELTGIFPKVSFAHAELVAKPLLERFQSGELASLTVIFTEFRSVASRQVVVRQFLPIPVPPRAARADLPDFGFRYEPAQDQLLAAILPRYAKAQLYRILLESQAAELAARMEAMEAATKNAEDLLGNLTLTLNRTRQAIITGELMEIVGGAEALSG